MTRTLVVGLDCVPPSLAFDELADAMPVLSALRERGTWGPLRSTTPPITVPAWASMASGRDPGELGVYGFRNRTRGSYALELVTSEALVATLLWERFARAGRTSAALFVPPSWPIRGRASIEVSCAFTPGPDVLHTHPESLAQDLAERFGPYLPDVTVYRGADRTQLLSELDAMCTQHFAIAKYVLRRYAPDFAMMVEIGPDRLHHALWKERTNDRAFRAYYAKLDGELGELLVAAGDDTNVIVASDHGARDLSGSVCVNEWLVAQGWLVLKAKPGVARALVPADVDWQRTRAWAEGGYHARVCVNVRGREPHGIVSPNELDDVRAELSRALETMRAPDGSPLGNRVVWPEREYRTLQGFAPDLLVFFGDLAWRASGTIGHGTVFLPGNDGAPDGCNHDWDGMFVIAGPSVAGRGRVTSASILDVAPTALLLGGLPVPNGLRGRDLRGIG